MMRAATKPTPENDLALLDELLRSQELGAGERVGFEGMRERVMVPRSRSRVAGVLTPAQREWVHRVANRLGVSLQPDNDGVPAGAPVVLDLDRMPRPLKPPGRRAAS